MNSPATTHVRLKHSAHIVHLSHARLTFRSARILFSTRLEHARFTLCSVRVFGSARAVELGKGEYSSHDSRSAQTFGPHSTFVSRSAHVSFSAHSVQHHVRITLGSCSVTRSAPSCGQRHSRGEQSRAHHSRSQHAGRRCRVRGCAVQESEWWVWKIARVRCSSSHVHVRCAVPCRVDKHSRCERHPKIDSHHLWAHPDPVSVLCIGAGEWCG